MDIGTYIRQLRIEKGLTQEELGTIVGVQRAAVQKWEKGSVQNLKRTTIQKLSEYFHVSPASFFDIPGNDSLSEFERLYNQLDTEDRAEIRGEIKQMLKSKKYKVSNSIAEDIADELKEDAHITVTRSKQ